MRADTRSTEGQKCENRDRAISPTRFAVKTQASSSLRNEARFFRDAVPDPEKQRMSPAASQQITAHSYRMVSEDPTGDKIRLFLNFSDFLSLGTAFTPRRERAFPPIAPRAAVS